MPRRYGADGTRLWNGKTPEEFTEADAYRFMAETEAVLQRKELMDDPAHGACGKCFKETMCNRLFV